MFPNAGGVGYALHNVRACGHLRFPELTIPLALSRPEGSEGPAPRAQKMDGQQVGLEKREPEGPVRRSVSTSRRAASQGGGFQVQFGEKAGGEKGEGREEGCEAFPAAEAEVDSW